MHLVVCVKAVPSTTEVKMDPRTNTIVRDGRAAVLNPFDATALELALQIKEGVAASGEPCRVTVLSMGIPDTERLLRDCIARGADAGLLLSDRAFAGADTLATTYALGCGVRALGEPVDLILCGKMAVDGDTAQIGPELAGELDIPCVVDVQAVEGPLGAGDGADEGTGDGSICRHGRLRAVRATDAGTELVEVDLPAVITVGKDAARLRMPGIPGVLASSDAPVAVLGADRVGADPARCGLTGSPTQVVRSFVPERADEAEPVRGDAREQAAKLAELIGGMA